MKGREAKCAPILYSATYVEVIGKERGQEEVERADRIVDKARTEVGGDVKQSGTD